MIEISRNQAIAEFLIFCAWLDWLAGVAPCPNLAKVDGLELVINAEYSQSIDELRDRAKETIRDIGNPFFRVLQILEHLRR